MKKLKLFEDFVLEAANIKDVAKNILNGLDNTAQLHVDYVPKEALSTIESSLKKNKSLSGKDAAKAAKEIRTNLEEIGILSNTFSPMDVEIIIMKHLNEDLNEATTSWSKMMKGVKAGESGPWSLVAIENNKVIGQRIDIKIKDILPAEFEALRKEFPKAKIHIEDSTGGVVWNESVVNEAKTLTREELMDLLENKYKIKTVRTSEEFNGQTEGIWVAGDNEEELNGNRIFYYYHNSPSKYTLGILKQVRTAVEKTGWWFEWQDPGTIIIWPNN